MNHKQERRFWLNVDREGHDAAMACWEWIGEKRSGYGRFFLDGRKQTAHRVIWEHCNGPIPSGMKILHRCDNPPCVRMRHLFLGTQADNVVDCATKGRIRVGDRKGEKHPLALLTNKDARIIRTSYGGQRGQIQRLAEKYEVPRKVISRIINNVSYQNV